MSGDEGQATAPSLLGLFAVVDDSGGGGYEHLRAVFRGMCEAFDLTAGSDSLGFAADPPQLRAPRPPGNLTYRPLAARQQLREPTGVWAVHAFEQREVVGLVLLAASDRDESAEPVWTGLEDRWRRAVDTVPPHPGVICDVIARQALLDGLALTPPPAFASTGCLTENGLQVAEDAQTVGGIGAHRRFLLLAPRPLEDVLSTWTWSDEEAGTNVQPFVRYLLHAGRLRHQARTLSSTLQLDMLERSADDGIRAVADLTRAGAQRRPGELRTALDTLRRLHLQETAWEIRRMTRTVASIRHNMADARPVTPPGDDPFAADEAVGEWLTDQLDAVGDRVELLRERCVREVAAGRAWLEALDRGLRDRLTLVQTSVLAALIMALAAIQSLDVKFRLPGEIRIAVVALLAALALLLPFAADRQINRRRWTSEDNRAH